MTQRIILNGGPKDKEIMEVGDELFHRGAFKCFIPPTATELSEHFNGIFVDNIEPFTATIPIKTGVYVRKQFAMGLFGTCEYRQWDEWHWQG